MTISFNPISPIISIIGNNNSNQSSPLAGAFESMLSDIRKVDKKIHDSMTGKIDLHELATDISLIETNLKTLVAIRDSLMSAIQELVRMQV